jgi:hypothetical protein
MACARSVPTNFFAGSFGYVNIKRMIISDPAPTEVMPTTSPPNAPMTTVGSGRSVSSCSEPVRSWPALLSKTQRIAMAAAPARSAAPKAFSTRPDPPNRCRKKAPAQAAGTDPAASHPTRRQFTVPRWA